MAEKKPNKTESVNVITLLRRASRELHKGMKPGGFHSSPKGKKGYDRKRKHKKRGDENL